MTSSSIHAAGAPGGGASARPNALVVLREHERARPGRDRLLEQVDRGGDVRVDEVAPRVAADVRLVQRRGVQHRVDARDRAARDVAVGERPDEVGVGRGQEVGAADVLARVAQDADERLAEMARAARDEDPHR